MTHKYVPFCQTLFCLPLLLLLLFRFRCLYGSQYMKEEQWSSSNSLFLHRRIIKYFISPPFLSYRVAKKKNKQNNFITHVFLHVCVTPLTRTSLLLCNCMTLFFSSRAGETRPSAGRRFGNRRASPPPCPFFYLFI